MITTIINSGATRTLIDLQVVERCKILYRDRKEPRYMRLGDRSTTVYSNRVIRLEIEPMIITISRIAEKRSIDIIELRQDEMLLGYN
jgi:hypothetical protein